MKKNKLNKSVMVMILACTVGVGVISVLGYKYQNQTVEIQNLTANTVELEETINLQAGEVEELRLVGTSLLEENQQLQDNLDRARQGNEKIRREIERLEKLESQKMVSRGRTTPLSFTTGSDVTVIRIDNGDLLNKGLRGKLKGLGWAFVKAGQKHGIDPLFLAAISAQESGWGKYDHGNNNIFGISSGAKYFSSYEECIYYTANLLSKHYVAKGLTTPALIQPKYCPSPNNWHFAISAVANTILKNI